MKAKPKKKFKLYSIGHPKRTTVTDLAFARHDFAASLPAVIERAGQLGLLKTMQALDVAVVIAGYEVGLFKP